MQRQSLLDAARGCSIDSPTQSGIHSFNPSHQQYSVIGDYRRVSPQADGAHNYSKQHQWQRLPMPAPLPKLVFMADTYPPNSPLKINLKMVTLLSHEIHAQSCNPHPLHRWRLRSQTLDDFGPIFVLNKMLSCHFFRLFFWKFVNRKADRTEYLSYCCTSVPAAPAFGKYTSQKWNLF